MLTTWEGADKRTSPTLWIRIDAHRAGFASGIGFTPQIRQLWRNAIGDGAGERLAAVLEQLAASRQTEVAGDQLKKVPAGFPPDHPRADLLRLTGFQVRYSDDIPTSVDRAEFAQWCLERLNTLLPVHRWLAEHLT